MSRCSRFGVDEAGIRRLFQNFSRGAISRWVKITDAAMHEQPRGFSGFKVSPAAFLIEGIQNNRMPPDWMYAHQKQQEREQWERDKAAFALTDQTLRDEYDRARAMALDEFRRSAEGSKIYDQTFSILQAFHKVADPHGPAEAARQATLSRMERENFVIPEFSAWMANQKGINANQAA